MITRRSFLKHLSCLLAVAFVPVGATIEPMGSVVNVATAENDGEWVCFETPLTLTGNKIDGSSSFEDAEERLYELFTGEFGEYNDVTIHRHN